MKALRDTGSGIMEICDAPVTRAPGGLVLLRIGEPEPINMDAEPVNIAGWGSLDGPAIPHGPLLLPVDGLPQ